MKVFGSRSRTRLSSGITLLSLAAFCATGAGQQPDWSAAPDTCVTGICADYNSLTTLQCIPTDYCSFNTLTTTTNCVKNLSTDPPSTCWGHSPIQTVYCEGKCNGTGAICNENIWQCYKTTYP
jgi:hypothetical protein